MTDKCNEVRDFLALEGKVPPGLPGLPGLPVPNDESLREHLETCVLCAAFLKSLSAVEAELGSLPMTDVDNDVVTTLLEREELKGHTRARGKPYWAMGLAAVAVIAFVAVRISVHESPQFKREAETADFNSVNEPVPRNRSNGALEADDERALASLAYSDKDGTTRLEEAPKKLDALTAPAAAAPPATAAGRCASGGQRERAASRRTKRVLRFCCRRDGRKRRDSRGRRSGRVVFQ